MFSISLSFKIEPVDLLTQFLLPSVLFIVPFILYIFFRLELIKLNFFLSFLQSLPEFTFISWLLACHQICMSSFKVFF